MAIEKTKKDKAIPSIREEQPKKSRTDKRQIVCSDQRRQYDTCGICGSKNIAFQGVNHCNACGREEEVLTIERFRPGMSCHKKAREYRNFKTGKKEVIHDSEVSQHGVEKCLDCGAVQGPPCPACKSKAWTEGLQRYCKKCGFRERH